MSSGGCKSRYGKLAARIGDIPDEEVEDMIADYLIEKRG